MDCQLQVMRNYRRYIKSSVQQDTFGRSAAFEQLSVMEGEAWNRLDPNELWSGSSGNDWTGTKFF